MGLLAVLAGYVGVSGGVVDVGVAIRSNIRHKSATASAAQVFRTPFAVQHLRMPQTPLASAWGVLYCGGAAAAWMDTPKNRGDTL